MLSFLKSSYFFGANVSKADEDVNITQTKTHRLIYFKGHSSSEKSALICRVCMHYETISSLLHGDHTELATRTLANLYNLWACRGNSILVLRGDIGGGRETREEDKR